MRVRVASTFAVLVLLGGCVAPGAAPDPATPEPGVRAAFREILCEGAGSCPVRATQGANASEMQVALDPRDPDRAVVAAKASGRDRISVAATSDGGRTWSATALPVDGLHSDPIVVFVPDGGVLLVILEAFPGSMLSVRPGGLLAWRSLDGGETWREEGPILPPGWTADHPWLAVDRDAGRTYLVTNAGPPEGEGQYGHYALASADSGRSWSDPVFVCSACFAPTLGVGGDGTVYVATSSFNDAGPDRLVTRALLHRSEDGGATWSDAIVVDEPVSAVGSLFACGGRSSRWTSLPAVAGGPGGRVHVAYSKHPVELPAESPFYECPNRPDWDVYVRSSEDRGRSWSDPVRVNDDSGPLAPQAVPAIAVSPAGNVHVLWYDARNDPSARFVDVYYAHSPDGRSFAPNLRVTAASFEDNGMLHDYVGLDASDERAMLAFAITEDDTADVFTALAR